MVRLLTIMGSGETAPTMVKTHRAVVERLGGSPARGVLLDTPFGFQTNTAEIASRAVEYFRESVGAELEIAGFRRADDLDDALVARIAAAGFVFAGPGSPTYALRQWRPTLLPGLLAEKLAHGGAVTFASAAALTLGVSTVPVYEIYKVGEEPRWEPGLDLLGPLGLQVAVIPHYDNAEGGTHDTRFCYLGEERLARLEQELPDGAFVLGVDEHTALTIDFDSGAVVVSGRGVVTVRVQGRSAVLAAGEEPALQDLHAIARRLASGAAVDSSAVPPGRAETPGGEDVARVAGATGGTGPDAGSPLIEAVLRLEAAFRAAKAASDARAMAEATLELEAELWAWRADTLQSDEADRGRAALRAMVAELGALAQTGARDPAEVYGPFVEVLLEQRDTARRERRFDEADRLRDRLADLGVEVRDGPEGSSWARL